MKLSLMVEELVWVPVILFCKISFPVTHLMRYYAQTGHFRPLFALLYDNFNAPSTKHAIPIEDHSE
jgi:hypothetical protein